MIEETLKQLREKTSAAIDFAKQDFSGVRTGRATPAMFSQITAEYYGVQTPLQQLATFHSPEPRMMMINPFDPGAINAIEKAVRNSDLGVNPTIDGKGVRVVFPELTEERRKDLIKVVRAKAEEAKVAIRGHRRVAMDAFKKAEKDGDLGEDEVRRAEQRVEDETKKAIEQIDQLLKAKEAELLEV